MKLYGIYSITHHGWSKVLTVMSDRGRTLALAEIEVGDGVEVRAEPGYLTQYHGRSTAHLERLVARYEIELLAPGAWAEKKAELGQVIFD